MNLNIDLNRDYVFVIENQGRKNAVIKDQKFPASVTIATSDTVLDFVEEDGKKVPKIRKTRYVQGEPSIFVDEQSADAKPTPITFYDGVLRVRGSEITKVQYLLNSNYNKNFPKENRQHNRFQYRLFDAVSDSNEAVNKQRNKVNLKARILNMPFEDLKHLALATATSEAIINQIYGALEPEIRHYMMREAEKNNDMFNLDLDNPVLHNKVIITRGVKEGLLNYNSTARRLSWAKNNHTIIQTSLGIDAIKELASVAQENEEYGSVIAEIKKTLKIGSLFSSQFEEKVEQVKNDMATGSVFEKIILAGCDKDVIIKNGNYYTYADKKHNGLKTFCTYLKENPTVFLNLTLELEKKTV